MCKKTDDLQFKPYTVQNTTDKEAHYLVDINLQINEFLFHTESENVPTPVTVSVYYESLHYHFRDFKTV
jgi:hypothetical protein